MDSPMVEASEPANYTTNFKSNKIVMHFDEFVAVSDVATEVFISPPFRNTPEIRTRGKSVIITFDEALRDSTTYSIFFGNAIKDITEGNPLSNYNYVFSTGDKIDSLSVVGEVLDAFVLEPRAGVIVMLYRDDNDTIPFDSLPYMVKPAYLTRTTDQGFFVINNIQEGEYAMFALADNNMSATYDNAEEEIGFLDSLVYPEYLAPVDRDSLLTDSLLMASDSLNPIDTLVPDLPLEEFYTLFLFKEVDTSQRVLDAEKPRERVLRFTFRNAAREISITPLTEVSDNWLLPEWSANADTLWYFITEAGLDTISLKIALDTIVFDTVSFSLTEEDIPQRKKEKESDRKLMLTPPKSGKVPHFKEFIMQASYPLTEYDFSRFRLVEGEDTLVPALSIYGSARRMVRLDQPLKPGTRYTLYFPDSVLTDMLGRSNDSTEFSFTADAYEEYGLYRLHVVNASPYGQLVVQLLDNKGLAVREEIVRAETTITWDYLKPGKYSLKAIADLNYDGKWGTGIFPLRRQPEPVVFNPEILEVREGWTFDLDWTIQFK